MAGRDPYRARRAAKELSDTIWDSYRAILEGTLAAHERNTELTLNVFEGGMETLEAQAKINRRAVQEVARRMREQREAFRDFARDSAEAYDDFLGSLHDYHRGASGKED